jgi:hypothetical protein
MQNRDRKNRKRSLHKKRRSAKGSLTCKFCNLAVTNVRRLAAHFRQCLRAQSSDLYTGAASEGCDTARDDSETCDSGSDRDDLTRVASWNLCACCDGYRTNNETCSVCEIGTETYVSARIMPTPSLATRPDISQYLGGLNPPNEEVDLDHINAYRDWGPIRPDASECEQARFLAVCDAGVGISDQHAQIILDYVRTREGPSLPKTVDTCWKNVERAHAKMCGNISKVVIVHGTGKSCVL